MKPGFGQMGSIDRMALRDLPEPMQREGLLLLKEMGCNEAEVHEATGFDDWSVSAILAGCARFRHATEWQGAQNEDAF